MKNSIVLSLLLYVLPTHAAPAGAAAAADDAAAHAAQRKKTQAEEVEYTETMALARIEAALAKKNIALIFKWLPTITDEQEQAIIFMKILEHLSPADFRGAQLNKFQQIVLDYQKRFGRLPQDFELHENKKKWGRYLLQIYPREQDVKSEAQKPRAPGYPAPRIERSEELVFLIGKERLRHGSEGHQRFAIPLAIARNPEIVGELIATTLEHDKGTKEILLNIRPHILQGLVDIFRLAKTDYKDLQIKPFFDIATRYTDPEQFEMMQAADYLGAQDVLEALAFKYVISNAPGFNEEPLWTLPRTVRIAIENAYYDFHGRPLVWLNLFGSDNIPVDFDRPLLFSENVVGPIMGQIAKSGSSLTPLPVDNHGDLMVLRNIFRIFYKYLRAHRKETNRSLEEKAVLAIEGYIKAMPFDEIGMVIRDLGRVKASILRQAFLTSLENRIARQFTSIADPEEAKQVIRGAALNLSQYLQPADWAQMISHFHQDNKLFIARDLFISQLIYGYSETLSLKELKDAGLPEDLVRHITNIFKILTKHELPAVRPEAEKKEKDEKAQHPAGHASPPPLAGDAIPLERQSSGREQALSPDAEAARKRG